MSRGRKSHSVRGGYSKRVVGTFPHPPRGSRSTTSGIEPPTQRGGQPEGWSVEHQNRDDLVYPILVDPYYETMWSNVAEAVWCSTNWIAAACLRAKNNATKALTQAESWYPKSLHNGIGDGFRHCYWNALMTVDDGPTTASKIATRHEDAAKNQPANEKTMDLRNNQIGRNIAGSKGSKTYASVRNSCKSRADAKTLWYLVSGKLKYGK